MITAYRVGAEREDMGIVQIENTLEAFQEVVEGYIEVTALPDFEDISVKLICNEEGLIHGLHVNENMLPYFFVGNLLIVAVDDEEFVSLTDDQKDAIDSFFALLWQID